MPNIARTNPDGISTGNETLTYDEVTFVPVVSSTSGTQPTYTVNSAKYTKVGNRCIFNISFTVTVSAGATGDLFVTAPLTVLEEEPVCISNPSSGYAYSGFALLSTSKIILYKYDGTTAISNARFLVSGSYRTA
jgi:hypothetical protein